MDLELQNYLYRNPALYDSIFRASGTRLKEMLHEILLHNGKEPPCSVLDIGCGTGFKLAHLQGLGYNCTGVDYLESMVSYARSEYPDSTFAIGDVRDLRLGRTFDVITSLGWVIENVHSLQDISQTMNTFAAHAKPGTLLVFDVHNAIGDLFATGSRREFTIERDDFKASAQATFDVDRRNQLLTRRRTWHLSDGSEEQDVAHFRLFFPMELEHYLASRGFQVVEMYDNTDLRPTELDQGSILFVTATYTGDNPEGR